MCTLYVESLLLFHCYTDICLISSLILYMLNSAAVVCVFFSIQGVQKMYEIIQGFFSVFLPKTNSSGQS